MTERMVTANGVELCTEQFGNLADPAVLLLSGAQESMLWWEDEFCRRLAAGGRAVIRYDQRDTGRSVTYPPGKPQYTLDDLVADAVGVLDVYGVAGAHLVGISMGGMVAQLLALHYPVRARTLTLIASSPHGPEDPDLPPMHEKILAFFTTMPPPDWDDATAVVEYMLLGRRQLVGSAHHFDAAAALAIANREVARARNLASAGNHGCIASERWRERLGTLQIPTLVVHGTEDPVLPFGHGEALAREIPGATLLPLPGTGHEVHRDDWDIIIPAILRHTA